MDLNRHFLKCLKMVNGNMKNFSPSLGNREVQIKIAVYCHSTTIRYPLAKIKKKMSVGEDIKRWDLCLLPSFLLSPSLHLSVMWVLCMWILISIIILINSMKASQTWKTQLSHFPAVPLLGIYPKVMKAICQKDIYTLMFTMALLIFMSISAKVWK